MQKAYDVEVATSCCRMKRSAARVRVLSIEDSPMVEQELDELKASRSGRRLERRHARDDYTRPMIQEKPNARGRA